jgi:succinate dehydrogenase / fumarate reductase iron-sulfur subunit
MNYQIRIKRQKGQNQQSYWQTFTYHANSGEKETIATVLTAVANRQIDRDNDGNILEPIGWECSCLQKKCGSCAMVIDGRPGLACDFFLQMHKGKKPIVLEPLHKFPVVRDLIVDRSVMRENLKKLQAWMETEASASDERRGELMYDASRCLQCGCCLEVCPNFCAGETFFGAAGAVPVSRIIYASAKDDRTNSKRNYKEHFYQGCGKSLACMDICPAGIKMDRMLSNTNALAIWR